MTELAMATSALDKFLEEKPHLKEEKQWIDELLMKARQEDRVDILHILRESKLKELKMLREIHTMIFGKEE